MIRATGMVGEYHWQKGRKLALLAWEMSSNMERSYDLGFIFFLQSLENLLPYDGEVQDYGCILSPEEAEQYFDYLYQHLAWKHDEAKFVWQALYYSSKSCMVWR